MRIFFLNIFLLLMLCALAQQQTLFTNYILQPYLYNPAYAGVNDGQQYSASYRNQWTGFDGAPVTMWAGGFGTLKKKPQMAIGGLLLTDRSGLLQRNSFHASYAYHLKLNKKVKLGLGVSAGAIQYNVKVYNAKPYPSDKDDAFLTSSILNAYTFDANAGFYLYSKRFFLGFSGMQLANSKIYWPNTNGRLTLHAYGSIGYTFTLDKENKEWELQPSVLFRLNNPVPYQFEPNLRVIYKQMIWIGGAYRFNGKNYTGASANGMIGATLSKQFTFAYSYDYALSALQQYSSGSHEVMISYTILGKGKTESEKVQNADEQEFNNKDNSIKSNLKNKK